MKASSIQEIIDPDYKSLHEFYINAATKIHSLDSTYLIRKENGAWVEYSYGTLLAIINKLASYFIHLGLVKGDRVAILLENCPEYYCIDQACMKLGLINVSIYPTLTPDETAFILNDSGSKLLIAGNSFLLKKFKKIEAICPTVIQILGLPMDMEVTEKFIHYHTAIEIGEQNLASLQGEIENRFALVERQDLATLIYTSGTTGVPKGAMLTHANFMTNCYDATELVPDINESDLLLSFLPLCHVYERMVTYYLGLYIGAKVAFSENIDKVAQNIMEVKPTIMACVPRLLERIHDKVVKNATQGGKFSRTVFLWSLRVGATYRNIKVQGKNPGILLRLQQAIAEKLVYSKVKAKMGGNMRLFVSGGGALPKHVGEFFANLGLKVQEGYGLTETSPFITVNEFNRQIYGTVGRIAPRQRVAIQNIETNEIIAEQTYFTFNPSFESGEGEILAKGPNIMKGYWQNKEETDKVFDKDGWFHTGDIGKFELGNLKITDRLKNMFCTSLGKNIFPTQVENCYLQSPKIEQMFLIGDQKEYVTAIIVPSQDELISDLGIDPKVFNESDPFIQDEKVYKWLMDDIKKYSESLAKFERVKDFIIKRTPFSIEDGDMTITLKIKRKVVLEKFAAEIGAMY